MINFFKKKPVEVNSANSLQAEDVNYEDPKAETDEERWSNPDEELLISDESSTEEEFQPEADEPMAQMTPNQTPLSGDGTGQASNDGETVSEGQGTSDVILTETVYKKAARWVLLIGVALIPLFFLPWTTSVLELNKQLLLVVVAGVGLVLWLLDVVMSGKLSWRFNPLDKGVLAIAGAVGLSSVFSVAKFKSVFGMAGSLSDAFLTVAGLTLVYLLIVNSFDDKGKKLTTFFSVSVVAAVIYGFLQIFGVYVFSIFRYFDISIFNFTISRAFNTLGSVNALGMTAAIILPMLYRQKISIFRPARGTGRYVDISRIGALAALAVLVVINWWVLWVVAVVGMVTVVVLESISTTYRNVEMSTAPEDPPEAGTGGRVYRNFRLSRFLFPMTVMVLGIFLVVVNLNLVFVKNNLPIEIAPSHKLSGNVAWKALQENFAFGYGPENFSLVFDKYGAGELRNTTLSGAKFFDATSQVLNMTVHNGIVGLAALGFALWLLGWSLAKNISTRQRNGQEFRNVDISSEHIGVISSTIAAVVAMFFYPFNLVLIFVFYVLLALVVLSVWGNRKVVNNVEEKASLSLISSLGFIGGLATALVGLYFMSLSYIADVKYAKALGQTETQKALDYVVEAINWKENDDRFYRLSSQLALNLLSQELNTKAVPDDTQKNNRVQNYLSSAVALAQKATQVAPNETNNWVNLGNVYQNLMQLVDGADALAERAYLKASELRPGDSSFHNRIGSMYLVKADLLRQLATQGGASAQQFAQQANVALLKAEDAFKKAIEMSNNFGLAIYNLGSVYERQGKLNEAIKQLETIAPFNSNQPGLAFELGLLYYRANRKNDALAQLQRAVVLFPDYANARWFLALIYEERKQLDRAIEQLERILNIEVNKDNEIVLTKLDELKAGRVKIPPGSVLDERPL
ncbi:MAG: tetratricopeptide repeat protein [Parcubacteria group bacterium]|nr:tetratricopeptide repeat protein [Parcubacteria group bacterium]